MSDANNKLVARELVVDSTFDVLISARPYNSW
jgi:hypothetical protein